MRKARGSGLPLTLLVKGYTERPPVLRPMRSVSSMKLSFSVPICVSALRIWAATISDYVLDVLPWHLGRQTARREQHLVKPQEIQIVR